LSAIDNIQARICFVGPMIALQASQQAAKNNSMYVNESFTDLLVEHASVVRNEYTQIIAGEMLFPEPYPGCWTDYAEMLELVAEDGIAAAPDNAIFFGDSDDEHILLNHDFYDAVAGANWCWFHNNGAETMLQDYENFFPCWWPDLPPRELAKHFNSEIYSLRLTVAYGTLPHVANTNLVADIAAERRLEGRITDEGAAKNCSWYCYSDFGWAEWDSMDTDGDDPFPATGPIRSQYDYTGADAVTRVAPTVTRLTPGPEGAEIKNTLVWTSAAKPFGYLEDDKRPNRYSLVLPAFRDVALIPLDGSSAPSGGSFNVSWRIHIDEHLPKYVDDSTGGPGACVADCWYCQQLVTWENPAFRSAGVEWLSVNSWKCNIPSSGGGGAHGGDASGHSQCELRQGASRCYRFRKIQYLLWQVSKKSYDLIKTQVN